MPRRKSFTEAEMKRAVKAVEESGLKVFGVQVTDGDFLIHTTPVGKAAPKKTEDYGRYLDA